MEGYEDVGPFGKCQGTIEKPICIMLKEEKRYGAAHWRPRGKMGDTGTIIDAFGKDLSGSSGVPA